MSLKRTAAVAGTFYPDNPAALRRLIGSFVDPTAKALPARAVIAPHAGYQYSGAVAGAVYSSVILPEHVVILAPAHRPQKTVFAVWTEGVWETPLGTVAVATDLAEAILVRCPGMVAAPEAHAQEHSLEVQIPFLQYFRESISLVPINVSNRASYDQLSGAGEAIAGAIRALGGDVLVIASTDMSHYVPAAQAKALDRMAIDRILALDPRGLVETVFERDISMCGVLPTAAAIIAAVLLGATSAELIAYATSGDVTGDDREVVGYAGFRLV
jgi:AmmeMemoRadiSam system protein B